jgi:asparagine synthase (glutamine-hydrolysing)
LESLFQLAPEITWHQDEPFGSTSIYAQWRVFELAGSEKVRVMLDGQGADEQLAGYHGFFGPHLASLFYRMHWLTMFQELKAMRRLHGYGYVRSGKYLASVVLPESFKDILRGLTGKAYVHPDWLDWQRLGAEPVNPFFHSGTAQAASVYELSVAQLTASNLQMLLHWEDRDSMAHSIEARVPFLDYRLVEYVLGLPDDFKLSQGITKRVLRDALAGILPETIRNRVDKLGFVTAEEVWLRQQAPDDFRDKLNAAIEIAGGVLNAEKSRALLEEIIAGKREFSFLPWRMINLGEWIKKFSVEII